MVENYLDNHIYPQHPTHNPSQFKKEKMASEQLPVAATSEDVGKKVLVFGIGQDPIPGIIESIDELTGRILTVVIKDENKRKRIIAVTDKVVARITQIYDSLPFFTQLFQMVKSWFRSKKQ